MTLCMATWCFQSGRGQQVGEGTCLGQNASHKQRGIHLASHAVKKSVQPLLDIRAKDALHSQFILHFNITPSDTASLSTHPCFALLHRLR
jgi:hypothetical protein